MEVLSRGMGNMRRGMGSMRRGIMDNMRKGMGNMRRGLGNMRRGMGNMRKGMGHMGKGMGNTDRRPPIVGPQPEKGRRPQRVFEVQLDELHEIAQRFRDASADVYSFKEGFLHNFGLEDCNTLKANGISCCANNPSSPYGLVMVPPPEGREEDLSECSSQWKPICEPNAVGEMATFPFHLQAEEAIIVLGVTPPEVKYFGFTNYLAEHTYPENFIIDPRVDRLSRCWEEGSAERRCGVFASMGDALNLGNLQPHGGGGPFDRPFAMVISPSQGTAERVAGELRRAGASAVNFLPLPGAGLSLGFEEGKDAFATFLRTAFPTDVTAYQAWLDQRPFVVLRATARRSRRGYRAELYPLPDYCPEGTSIPPPMGTYCLTRRSAAPEAERVGLETERLQAAQAEVARKLAQTIRGSSLGNSQTTNFGSTVPDSGLECLAMGSKCQGDSRDTYYPASVEFVQNALMAGAVVSGLREQMGLDGLTMEEMASATVRRSRSALLTRDGQDTMWVVGVLHSATKASLYSSLSVYDLVNLQGVMSVADDQVRGSAMKWLRGTSYEDLVPYLFVAEFTRSRCEGRRFCFDVPTEGELSIPEDTPLLFIERMYFDERTHVGIAPEAAIAAMLVHNVLQSDLPQPKPKPIRPGMRRGMRPQPKPKPIRRGMRRGMRR